MQCCAQPAPLREGSVTTCKNCGGDVIPPRFQPEVCATTGVYVGNCCCKLHLRAQIAGRFGA